MEETSLLRQSGIYFFGIVASINNTQHTGLFYHFCCNVIIILLYIVKLQLYTPQFFMKISSTRNQFFYTGQPIE